jgi:hypothetical protein
MILSSSVTNIMSTSSKKIAVIFGSQGRCLDETGIYNSYKSITTFLSLFDVDYDIFVFTDKEYKSCFSTLPNIKQIVLHEDTDIPHSVIAHFDNLDLKQTKSFGPHAPLWQNYKLAMAFKLVQPYLNEYTHILKMRTDLSVNFEILYEKCAARGVMGFEDKKLTLDNFNYNDYLSMKRYVQLHLELSAMPHQRALPYETPGYVFGDGDRFLLGSIINMDPVLTSFLRPDLYERIQYTYDPNIVIPSPIRRPSLDHVLLKLTYPDYIFNDIANPDVQNPNLLSEIQQSLQKNYDRLVNEKLLPPERCASFSGAHGTNKRFPCSRHEEVPGPQYGSATNCTDPRYAIAYVDDLYYDTQFYRHTKADKLCSHLFHFTTLNLRLSKENDTRAFWNSAVEDAEYQKLLIDQEKYCNKIAEYNKK